MRAFRFENGDLVYNQAGYFEKTSGLEKKRRDLFKRLITDKEFTGNESYYYRYNPTYGTELNNKRIFSNLSREDIINTINQLINSALQAEVANQISQSNLPFDELIEYVDFFTSFDNKNKALAKCKILVKLSSGQVLDLGTFTQEI